jgi:GNAT superfamily N-acetyltransferase
VSAGPEIRPFRREDAAAAAALLSPLAPADYPVTTASLEHEFDTLAMREGECWVAESADGQVVGWAERSRHLGAASPDVQRVWAAVRPDHRRRGLGRRLLGLAEERALTTRPALLRTWAMAGEPAADLLRVRGYELRRTERMWALDPATVDLSDLPRREREAAAAGYRLVPLREALDRPEELYRTCHALDVDVPNDVEVGGVSYEQWLRLDLGDPLLDRDGSVVVLNGDEPVGIAWLAVDHEHGLAGNAMTGTLRAHRRRGLARLAKLATIRWAVEHGIRRIGTGNDSTNRDMLTLNDHLGYRPLPDFLILARTVRLSTI